MVWCSVVLCLMTLIFCLLPARAVGGAGALYLQDGICLCLPERTTMFCMVRRLFLAFSTLDKPIPCALILSN